MTIECYFKSCPRHSYHSEGEDGPFCYEGECKASPDQLSKYENDRNEVVRSYRLDQLVLDMYKCLCEAEVNDVSPIEPDKSSTELMKETLGRYVDVESLRSGKVILK